MKVWKEIGAAHLRIKQFRDIILSMPIAHRDMVVVLLVFFKLIARFSHVNKMTPHNIAVCFSPSIFKAAPKDFNIGNIELFDAVRIGIEVLEFFIVNIDDLLPPHVQSLGCDFLGPDIEKDVTRSTSETGRSVLADAVDRAAPAAVPEVDRMDPCELSQCPSNAKSELLFFFEQRGGETDVSQSSDGATKQAGSARDQQPQARGSEPWSDSESDDYSGDPESDDDVICEHRGVVGRMSARRSGRFRVSGASGTSSNASGFGNQTNTRNTRSWGKLKVNHGALQTLSRLQGRVYVVFLAGEPDDIATDHPLAHQLFGIQSPPEIAMGSLDSSSSPSVRMAVFPYSVAKSQRDEPPQKRSVGPSAVENNEGSLVVLTSHGLMPDGGRQHALLFRICSLLSSTVCLLGAERLFAPIHCSRTVNAYVSLLVNRTDSPPCVPTLPLRFGRLCTPAFAICTGLEKWPAALILQLTCLTFGARA